jgi:hypothetical protein
MQVPLARSCPAHAHAGARHTGGRAVSTAPAAAAAHGEQARLRRHVPQLERAVRREGQQQARQVGSAAQLDDVPGVAWGEVKGQVGAGQVGRCVWLWRWGGAPAGGAPGLMEARQGRGARGDGLGWRRGASCKVCLRRKGPLAAGATGGAAGREAGAARGHRTWQQRDHRCSGEADDGDLPVASCYGLAAGSGEGRRRPAELSTALMNTAGTSAPGSCSCSCSSSSSGCGAAPPPTRKASPSGCSPSCPCSQQQAPSSCSGQACGRLRLAARGASLGGSWLLAP